MGRRGRGTVALVVGAALLTGCSSATPTDDGTTQAAPTDATSSTPSTEAPTSEGSPSPMTPGERVEVGNGPCSVAEGDGLAYVSLYGQAAVVVLDSDSLQVVDRFDTDDQPCALVVAGGALWTATLGSDAIVAYDTATGEELARVEVEGKTWDLRGDDEALWASIRSLDPRLVRLDPSTGEVTGTWELGGSPTGLLVTDDAVWADDQVNGTVYRLDRSTDDLLEVDVDWQPSWYATVDGQVWVTDRATGDLVQLDPTDGTELARATGPGRERDPTGFAGAVLLPDADGPLWRIDPDTATADVVADLEGAIFVARVIGDRLWVLDFGGTLVHVLTESDLS